MKYSSKRPNPVDIHVGHRVRQQRVAAGLSQTQLAEACGVTFQQLQKYEQGTNRVSASRLWQLAQVLGVPVQTFFLGLAEEETPAEIVRTGRATLELVRRIEKCEPDVRRHLSSLLSAFETRETAAAAAE